MIHSLRKVAREIHRRSVWQVLGVYVAGAWVGLRGIQLLTEQVGLPAWTPTFAAVLAAVGLPVVIATAVVQCGIPWLRIEDEVDPNELLGLTPEEVLVIPEAHPLYGEGILTWRNAILGGIMGLSLLVTSVVAYLTMWALGIGPVGSLLAQGVIADGEPVLLAEFQNRTDAAGLGRAVTEAFARDMAECSLITLVDGALASRPVGPSEPGEVERLTPALAREHAARERIRVLVEGEIRRHREGYRISASILLPPFTSPASRFEESVSSDEDLVPAIDLLAERVRSRLGESLRVIRGGSPLTELYGAHLELSSF